MSTSEGLVATPLVTLKEALQEDETMKMVISADGAEKVLFVSKSLENILGLKPSNQDWGGILSLRPISSYFQPARSNPITFEEAISRAQDDTISIAEFEVLAVDCSRQAAQVSVVPISSICSVITHFLVMVKIHPPVTIAFESSSGGSDVESIESPVVSGETTSSPRHDNSDETTNLCNGGRGLAARPCQVEGGCGIYRILRRSLSLQGARQRLRQHHDQVKEH